MLILLGLIGLHLLAFPVAVLLIKNITMGFKLSLFLMSLQMFQVSAKVIDVAFVQGLSIRLVTSTIGTNFSFSFTGNGNLYFASNLPWGIGVNIVAVGCVFWLLRRLRYQATISEPSENSTL
jgi:hypothetical protein